jgi:hypothetical protein
MQLSSDHRRGVSPLDKDSPVSACPLDADYPSARTTMPSAADDGTLRRDVVGVSLVPSPQGERVADWTDEEKREFEKIYQKELEDRKQRAESFEVDQTYKRELEDRKQRTESFNAGEHVETPEGLAVIVATAMGGYRVKLVADLPALRPGHVVEEESGEGAFFVPTSLLRKSEPSG